jgi:hypothetical protein
MFRGTFSQGGRFAPTLGYYLSPLQGVSLASRELVQFVSKHPSSSVAKSAGGQLEHQQPPGGFVSRSFFWTESRMALTMLPSA